jgi:hypothetical protein
VLGLIINVVPCPPGALIWKIKYLVSCIMKTSHKSNELKNIMYGSPTEEVEDKDKIR